MKSKLTPEQRRLRFKARQRIYYLTEKARGGGEENTQVVFVERKNIDRLIKLLQDSQK